MQNTFIPKSSEKARWKAGGMEKQGAGEKVLTSQNKKSIERRKVWLFHEECVYVWESRSSCGTHDWRDSYPRPHVSQSPPLPFCPTLPRSVLHRAVAAVKQPFWEQQTHEEVLVCQTSVLYPLLWDCSPAEYRRHREASINLWPLVETDFPHTSSLVLSLTLCLHPTSLHTWV